MMVRRSSVMNTSVFKIKAHSSILMKLPHP